MRPIGSAEELERRRRRAVKLVEEGESPKTIALILGVALGSVYRWCKMAQENPDGLKSKPHSGRDRSLSEEQHKQLEALLKEGPEEHGWSNDLWTAKRVAEIIRRHLGISYHPEHVRKILKQRLNWTSQKPEHRARERNEEKIEQWIDEDFPQIIIQTQERGGYLVFWDESGFMLTPTVRRTFAPRGKTPIHYAWDSHDRISAISAITISPKLKRLGLIFHLLPNNFNVRGENIIESLRDLKKHIHGPMTILWDGSPTHRSKLVKGFLEKLPEIVIEPLPPYAPELNPDEGVWRHTKYNRLANYAPPNINELRVRLIEELNILRKQPDYLASFIRFTKLPLLL